MNKHTTWIFGACLLVVFAGVALGSGLRFESDLSPAQEVSVPAPASVTIDRAEVEVRFSEDLSSADVVLRVEPSAPVVAAHFHCNRAGQNGPVAFGLISPGSFVFSGDVAAGTLTNANFSGADCVPAIGRPVNNIAALALAMRDGLIYANVHTANNPGGEFRGQMLPDDDDEDEDGDDEDDDHESPLLNWKLRSEFGSGLTHPSPE